MVSKAKGDYENALRYYLRSLEISENTDDKSTIAKVLNNIGNIFFAQRKYHDALNYHSKALATRKEIGDKNGMASSLNNIGIVYGAQGKLEKASEYFLKYLETSEETGDKEGISISLSNLGHVYSIKKDFEKALEYLLRSFNVAEEMGNKKKMSIALINIGGVYNKKANHKKALDYQIKSLEIAKGIGAKHLAVDIYKNIADTYIKLKDYKKAVEYQQLYAAVKDTIFNEKSSEQIAEMQTKYETEKKVKEIELLKKENEIKDLAVSKQKLLRNSFIAGLALALALALLLYNRYRIKQKANTLLEEKNKKITDSIQYAQIIQNAILPSGKLIVQTFPQHFIIFKPKDVVSGDFYYYAKQGDKHIIAAVDCTGHGVPGAFMSMIGYELLNQIITEKAIVEPAEILTQLHKGIKLVLQQDKEDAKAHDGMDIALCNIDLNKREIQFSGAHRPLYIINSKKEIVLREINPDRFGIGGLMKVNPKFTNHELKIDDYDTIYLFSDGFADQFGGPKERKFMTRQFKDFLCSVQDLTMDEQHKVIEQELNTWQGDLEQTDDILVMGIRFAEDKREVTIKLTLSDTEKTALKPMIANLLELKVYDAGKIMSLLKQIQTKDNKELKKWQDELNKAVLNFDEKQYHKLLGLI